MQLHATATPPTVHAPVVDGMLVFDGVHRSWNAESDEPVLEVDARLYAGRQVGSPTGYATLEGAIRSAQYLTHWSEGHGWDNDQDAILAVRDGERYVLREARERVANADGSYLGVRSERVDFEYLEDWKGHSAELPTYEHPGLRALIDGMHVQRFRPGAVEPGTRP